LAFSRMGRGARVNKRLIAVRLRAKRLWLIAIG
jgi:hypothetical protein